MKTMSAVIKWLSPEEGGRKVQPVGPVYVTDAKFLSHSEKWEIEGWDLVVRKTGDFELPSMWLAEVRFRVQEAPHEWLTSGALFELYEGRQKVAEGSIK